MKQIIKRLLAAFGIGIYRIPSQRWGKNAGGDWFPTMSPDEHNSQEGMDRFYSHPAMLDQYVDSRRIELWDAIVDVLIRHGGKLTGEIVDVGCGTGHLLQRVNEKYGPASITGFDFSSEAIKVAATTVPDAKLTQFDIYSGVDRKFDVVMCIEVLEHLTYPHKALENIVSMIRPGGLAILTVPNGRDDQYHGHINFWSPESWEVFVKMWAPELSVETCPLQSGRINCAVFKSNA